MHPWWSDGLNLAIMGMDPIVILGARLIPTDSEMREPVL